MEHMTDLHANSKKYNVALLGFYIARHSGYAQSAQIKEFWNAETLSKELGFKNRCVVILYVCLSKIPE